MQVMKKGAKNDNIVHKWCYRNIHLCSTTLLMKTYFITKTIIFMQLYGLEYHVVLIYVYY